MEIGENVFTPSEAEFDQIRAFADDLQRKAEAARIPRFQVVAAMGIMLGEQYPSAQGLKEALAQINQWAMIAHTKGEDVQ